MFGKLKDKLKKSLSVFSKKTEEEAEVSEASAEKVIEPEQAKEEVKEDISAQDIIDSSDEDKEKIIEKEPKEEIINQNKVIEEKKEEPEVIKEKEAEDVIEEREKAEEPEVEKEEVVTEKEVSEEKLEQLDQEIENAKKQNVKEVPQEFDIAKQKFEPDVEKIKEKEEQIIEKEIVKEEKKVKDPETKEELKEIKEATVKEKITEVKELAKEESKKEKKSFFGRIKESLTTKSISEKKFEELFWDLELVLLESNVSVKVIEKIKEDLKEELVEKPLPRDVPAKIKEVLKNTLTEILSIKTFSLPDRIQMNKEQGKPFTITFFGINGAGKTTTIAKLTHLLKKEGFSVVLAASDTFRAAAIQQLEDHANKLGVKMIKHDYGSDSAAVAYDAVKYAEKNKVDVVLVDTAGRLHSNTNLMAELEKICRVAKPDMKIFIGESITGNDCIEQAERFNDLVELDAAILSKADVDEVGGAPLSIAYTIQKPILYLGMGQTYDDLEEFSPELILKRLGF